MDYQSILNFLLKVSLLVVAVGVFFPIVHLIGEIKRENNDVKYYFNKRMPLLVIFMAIFGFTLFYSVNKRIIKKGLLYNKVEVLEPQNPTIKYYVVIVEEANIRSGPSTEFQVVGIVKKNRIVEVVIEPENDNEWYKIKYNNTEGYIFSSLIKQKP